MPPFKIDQVRITRQFATRGAFARQFQRKDKAAEPGAAPPASDHWRKRFNRGCHQRRWQSLFVVSSTSHPRSFLHAGVALLQRTRATKRTEDGLGYSIVCLHRSDQPPELFVLNMSWQKETAPERGAGAASTGKLGDYKPPNGSLSWLCGTKLPRSS